MSTALIDVVFVCVETCHDFIQLSDKVDYQLRDYEVLNAHRWLSKFLFLHDIAKM